VRVGDVLLAVTGALGAAAVLVSAGLKELADRWAAAAPIALAVSMWRRAATGARGLPSPTGSPGVVGP
jgi:hypothetical protein